MDCDGKVCSDRLNGAQQVMLRISVLELAQKRLGRFQLSCFFRLRFPRRPPNRESIQQAKCKLRLAEVGAELICFVCA